MYSNHLEPSEAKVTLSCRVMPSQKLLLAERAERMSMSLAQYVEAKVLQEDTLKLEDKIEGQRKQIARQQREYVELQKELEQLKINHALELRNTKTSYSEKIKKLSDDRAIALKVRFENSD